MTFDEIIAKIVSGAIDLGIRILIAVIVFYIGKLVINKIYSIVKSIMLKHKLDKSLSTFVLSACENNIAVHPDCVGNWHSRYRNKLFHSHICIGWRGHWHGSERNIAELCRRCVDFIYKAL